MKDLEDLPVTGFIRNTCMYIDRKLQLHAVNSSRNPDLIHAPPEPSVYIIHDGLKKKTNKKTYFFPYKLLLPD